jgi:cell division protein FtsB
MLGFLKKLFAREQEVPVEEVELANLHSWFDENTKSNVASLSDELKQVNERVSQEIEQARKNIVALNNAELLNPNIPERAKHFMQGNREAYSKKIGSFLDRVHVPYAISDFPVFHSAVQEELKELTQGTAKSFQILQEFFANESRQVMANVGSISKEINSFKEAFDTAGLDILDDTRKRITDFQTKLELRQALEKDLDARKRELEEHSAEVRQLKQDVELLQKDKELSDLKARFKQAQQKVEQVRERILGPFSVINTALRKFERITYRHRMIVQKYIDSPLDALLQDLHLSILKALHDLEMAVLNNKIDLKDKKKDKTLEVMKLLTREYLGSFLTEYGQIKHEQDRLKKQIANLDVVVLLKQKKERIQKLENERIDIERKIDLFSKELSKVDIDELENKLVENLRKITGVKVVLKT